MPYLNDQICRAPVHVLEHRRINKIPCWHILLDDRVFTVNTLFKLFYVGLVPGILQVGLQLYLKFRRDHPTERIIVSCFAIMQTFNHNT